MPAQPSRQSLYPTQQQQGSYSGGNSSSGHNNGMSANKSRQYAHLHSQLAQLNAHLADTENIVRVSAVQALDIRFLGGYVGAMLMGSAKILGEESMKGKADGDVTDGSGGSQI